MAELASLREMRSAILLTFSFVTIDPRVTSVARRTMRSMLEAAARLHLPVNRCGRRRRRHPSVQPRFLLGALGLATDSLDTLSRE